MFTHPHPHTHIYIHTQKHTHTLSLSLSLTHIYIYTLILSFFLSLFLQPKKPAGGVSMFGGSALQEPDAAPAKKAPKDKGLFDATDDDEEAEPESKPAAASSASAPGGGPDIKNALTAALAARVSDMHSCVAYIYIYIYVCVCECM